MCSRWTSALGLSELEDDARPSLIDEILASHGARDLARTPLLLTILVLLWHRGVRLPQRTAELYDLATVTLLRDWPARRRVGELFDDHRLRALLQPVGLDLLRTGAPTVGDSRI